MSLSIIDDVLGNINISLEDIDDKYNELKEEFELIEKSDVCFKSYAYGTGYYSYYDEEYDYNYYDDEGIAKLLKETFDLGIYLVNNKEYKLALEVFNLIIYTNYYCQEVNTYDDDEVIDCYDIDLIQVEELLDFDLKKLYSYAIYAAYFCENRYQTIYNYMSCYKKINLEECKNLGIEEMGNLEKFYQNWINFLTNISDELAQKLIKDAMLNIEIDEYEVCKKSFKTHPNLYKEYILKLLDNCEYDKIITTYEEAIKEITDNKIRESISYIVIDAINCSKNELDKSKYFYTIFNSVPNISNFLIILNNKLYNDEIKQYVNKLSYEYREFSYLTSYLTDKSYYDFFLGDFENVYINKFDNINNIEDNILYLMILYLCDTKNMTLLKESILRTLTRNFNEYHLCNLGIDLNNEYSSLLEKFDIWKQNNQLDEELKKLFIDKILLKTNNEVAHILENKIRNMYSNAAILTVMLDEVLSNNNIIKDGEYVSEIEKKYVRFNAFRRELKKYK